MRPSTSPPSERPAQVADATEHRGGERLDADDEPDVELRDLEEEDEEEPGGARHDAAEEEREHHDPVDVHAHERGRLGVLCDRSDAAPEAGAVHELIERHHHDERPHDDDDLVDADWRCRRC